MARRTYRLIGLAAVMLAVWYFARFALRYAGSLPPVRWNTPSLLGLLVALLGYMLVVWLTAATWQIYLRGVGEPSALRLSVPVFAVAQFGKYIPGNVAQHFGRVALAAEVGYSPARVIATLVLEAAWSILASLFVAGAALALAGRPALEGQALVPSSTALVALAAAALLTPIGGMAALSWLPHWMREKLPWLREVRVPHPPVLFLGFVLACVNLLVMGGIVILIAATTFGGSGRAALTVIGIFALAWVAGFITPGAPAGLGVRDALLVAGLTPVYGAGIALGVTLATRLVTAGGDALAFGLGLIARQRLMATGRQMGAQPDRIEECW